MSGRYTYICEDCGEKQTLTRAERASRFRPRCRFCGSLHLVPTNKDMVENRETMHGIVRQEQKDKSQRMSSVSRKRKRNKK